MSDSMDMILFFVQGGLQYTRLNGDQKEIEKYFEKIEGMVKSEIERPKRNCDVGTPREQAERFNDFCNSHYNLNNPKGVCSKCPLTRDGSTCEFEWSQMPYEHIKTNKTKTNKGE